MIGAGSMLNAQSESTIGGHFGVVTPIVTWSSGNSTNLLNGNDFSIGFAAGIAVKGSGRMTFDLEFVPFIVNEPRQVTLTIQPGLIWSLGRGWGAGARLAFDVNTSSWGFTPLFNKSFPIHNNYFKSYYFEADWPIRFNHPPNQTNITAYTFAAHFGVGF
jgi:hypothetical protein